jgi:hypothetical protein
MADIIPKIKLYLFLTVMMVIINLGIFACKQTTDFLSLIASIGTSFIPFAGLITLFAVPSDLPLEFLAFAGLIIGIFSGILTAILATSIWSMLPFIDT